MNFFLFIFTLSLSILSQAQEIPYYLNDRFPVSEQEVDQVIRNDLIQLNQMAEQAFYMASSQCIHAKFLLGHVKLCKNIDNNGVSISQNNQVIYSENLAKNVSGHQDLQN